MMANPSKMNVPVVIATPPKREMSRPEVCGVCMEWSGRNEAANIAV